MAPDDFETSRVKRWRQGSIVRPDNGTIHVWRMPFSSANRAKQAWPLMNELERARASAFRFELDYERFCESRLLLRCVLGRYLDLDPAKVAMARSQNGKPFIDNSGNHGLQFNLTHCQSEALLAVTSGQSVGIDVEDGARIGHADIEALSQDLMTNREAQIIRALGGADRIRAFLLCWTRKEALLKAVGLGLLAKLNNFEVLFDCTRWQVKWAPDESTKASTFEMVDLSEGNIIAAVAARKIVGPVVISNFQDLDFAAPCTLG